MYRIINIGTLSQNKFWGETTRMRREISATCTLLEVGGKRLLVDPSPHPDVLATLLFNRAGLRPDAIDLIFLTHFHGDHRFGLALFEHATWLMTGDGLAEWSEHSPVDLPLIERFQLAEEHLPEGVEPLAAPGHTANLYALTAETQWGPLVIAGDAVMNREFFAAGEGYHNSVDFEQAATTIRKIKAIAALVIPGHDNVILNLHP
jgi:glyoxylase-like metal-dependent hydrolase (beta-lactamase superfamily II)